MTGPATGLAKNHCVKCKLSYLSPYYPKYSTCPQCHRNGDRDSNVVPYVPQQHGPMSAAVERR